MRRMLLAGVAALVLVGVSACSDDGDDATTATGAADPVSAPGGADPTVFVYCTSMDAAFTDSGFNDVPSELEAFFTEHPDPTLDDWAAFLPDTIATVDSVVVALEAVTPPADLAEAHQTLIASVSAVGDAYEDGLAAADAGDQAAYDASESLNQAVASPAMEEAFGPLGEACGGTD